MFLNKNVTPVLTYTVIVKRTVDPTKTVKKIKKIAGEEEEEDIIKKFPSFMDT